MWLDTHNLEKRLHGAVLNFVFERGSEAGVDLSIWEDPLCGVLQRDVVWEAEGLRVFLEHCTQAVSVTVDGERLWDDTQVLSEEDVKHVLGLIKA